MLAMEKSMNVQLLCLQNTLNSQKTAMLDMQKSLGGFSSPSVSVHGFASRLNCPEAGPSSMETPVAGDVEKSQFFFGFLYWLRKQVLRYQIKGFKDPNHKTFMHQVMSRIKYQQYLGAFVLMVSDGLVLLH